MATPTAMKLLKGTAQKCRINGDEPMPADNELLPPPQLSQKALQHWQYFVGLIKQNNCLTNVDVVSVGLLCDKYQEYWELSEFIEKEGYMMASSRGDHVKNPACQLRSACFTEMVGLMKEYGLTAVARSKVVATKPEGGGNPFGNL